jgi:dienelactone hydrolase
MEERRFTADGIPILLVLPERVSGPLAVWMSHLGGSKEQCLEMLRTLAGAGLPAVSFDAIQHGERAVFEPMQVMQSVMFDFRRLMWPLLGVSTLDAMRVIDIVCGDAGRSPEDEVVAGGVSMGGDIAVALAGIDDRVTRVAALGSTPDWSRPGMRKIDDPSVELDQGNGDRYSHWLRDRLDPMLHVESYTRGPLIAFECGDADTHVPPDGAERFKERLTELDPEGDTRIRVTRHEGLDHFGVCRSPEATTACAAFLVGGGGLG